MASAYSIVLDDKPSNQFQLESEISFDINSNKLQTCYYTIDAKATPVTCTFSGHVQVFSLT